MNRQEALDAMRQGKVCVHDRILYRIRDTKHPGTLESRHQDEIKWVDEDCYCYLLCADCDKGWEIANQKVKKIYWIAIFESLTLSDAYRTSRAFPTKEEAIACCSRDDLFAGVYPVEIEVEE